VEAKAAAFNRLGDSEVFDLGFSSLPPRKFLVPVLEKTMSREI
jgi:hypothetical protein